MLADNGTDFTLAFRRLGRRHRRAACSTSRRRSMPGSTLARAHRARSRRTRRRGATPCARPIPLYIPRNHRVEAALTAAIERDDYGPFEELLTVLARPFEERPEFAAYAQPPSEEEQRNFRTFCGT